jgi:uncharacterized protein (DUF4415 family)
MQLCTYNNISIVSYMKHKPRVTKGGKGVRKSAGSSSDKARRKSRQRKSLSLTASVEPSKRSAVSMREVMEFYKPIKKPVTLRLDADVLAWFRRDGRRYQTRINAALRRVMEKEMKEAGD